MKKSLFWFRNDLRIQDNVGLYKALSENDEVIPIFIFDTFYENFNEYDYKNVYLFNIVNTLKKEIRDFNSDLIIRIGNPIEILFKIIKLYEINKVYFNNEYEPNKIKRDKKIINQLKSINCLVEYCNDNLLIDPHVFNKNIKSYNEYELIWKKKLNEMKLNLNKSLLTTDAVEVNIKNKFKKFKDNEIILLENIGIKEDLNKKTKLALNQAQSLLKMKNFMLKFLKNYEVDKDYPIKNGNSFLSVYIKYGLVGIRQIINQLQEVKLSYKDEQDKSSANKFLKKLIWREFFYYIMLNYENSINEPIKEKFKTIKWENNMFFYQQWCNGNTGYPIVDAAMRQLNQTGFINNKLRLIVASFLIQVLLIDYKLGEQYFALKLFDYDIAINNGNWQWILGSSLNQNQFIYIFSPIKQSIDFDKNAEYIKKYIPELKNVPAELLHDIELNKEKIKHFNVRIGKDYPEPIVSFRNRRDLSIKTLNK